VALGGANNIKNRWQTPRSYEQTHEQPHRPTVKRFADELMVLFEELAITDPGFFTRVHVIARVADLSLEGNGEASTMHRTIEQSIIDAVGRIKTKFPQINMLIGTRHYKDDDVEQPYIVDSLNRDMTEYLSPGDTVYYIDSGSLRSSEFPIYAAMRRSNSGLNRKNVDYSDIRSADLGSRLACAVRARCGEIHDIPVFVGTDDGRVPLRSVFVAVQIHLHCWSVMSLVLPRSRLTAMLESVARHAPTPPSRQRRTRRRR
jgi:hypothetical protein